MPYIGTSPSNGVRRKHTYTATASQTSFSGAGAEGATLSYTDSNFVDVYQNGVKLSEADYTSTSGTAIVLAQGASVNDIVEVVVYDVFSVADTVSASEGGTFSGAVTFSGGATGIGFPSGTSMLFQQTAAPTGWTKQTTHNDKALRIITGTVGTGGSVAFSTALGSGATVAGGSVSGSPDGSNLSVSMSGNISNTTLSTSQIPSHSHPLTIYAPYYNAGGVAGYNGPSQGTINTGNTGGGGSHNHGHNLSGSLSGNIGAGNLAVGASTAAINVNYVDFIIANKD